MLKRVLKTFIKGFIISFIIVFILIGVGILSYSGIMRYFKVPDIQPVHNLEDYTSTVKITEAVIDEVSKNLIYCVNEETGMIEKLLLEIFHCEKNQLTYITIPVRSQFTMSNKLYQTLILVHPAIPQMIKLSGITKYFSQEMVYDYGVLMIEDMLDISMSYYTVIPKSLYDTMFISQEVMIGGEALDRSGNQAIEVFSEEYYAYLSSLQTAEDISNYLERLYQLVQSNLSLEGKMNYLESYCRTPKKNISFVLLEGEDSNSAYLIDQPLAKEQIQNYLKGVPLP